MTFAPYIGGYYTLPSQTIPDTIYRIAYRVHPGRLEWRCTCPARCRCKHIDYGERLFRAGLAGGTARYPFAARWPKEAGSKEAA